MRIKLIKTLDYFIIKFIRWRNKLNEPFYTIEVERKDYVEHLKLSEGFEEICKLFEIYQERSKDTIIHFKPKGFLIDQIVVPNIITQPPNRI